MAIQTIKYRRRPIYVDAVQITEKNFVEVAEWCMGDILWQDGSKVITSIADPAIDPSQQYIRVRVNNPKYLRQTMAYVGDWILYSPQGYKIYTKRAFEAAFELAEEKAK
jgi:hypothetical protein